MIARRLLLLPAALLVLAAASSAQETTPRFEVTFAPAVHAGPITGRLVVIVAKKDKPEPRLQVSPIGPALYAIDIDQLAPGKSITVDAASATDFPKTQKTLPSGDYYVQALIDVYTLAQRSDGHNVWVRFHEPGAEEILNTTAGNIYSKTQQVHVGDGKPIKLEITEIIPKPAPEPDTEWVKHVSIQSKKLTEFWGRPIFINATVLLPKGYEQHPNSHYPVVFTMGHGVPFEFDTKPDTPADEAAEKRRGLETGYKFYQAWNSDHFPRFIAISFHQPTPFFPDSYSVNSVNQGPYGDAMVEEVIPALEKQFRLIPKGYARQVEGASTGGWQTLALQLYHPDFFGGAWVLQPDPIDFRHYQLCNIYDDDNAFSLATGPFSTTERPMRRAVNGQVFWTERDLSAFEDALGSHGRSGFQLEAWEAIYGPVGADGYPVPLWDKTTGKIDHNVANYMRDHGYDLRIYAEKNWATLGPKVVGKLHFFAGDMDDFYLNLAVYDFQDFLKSSQNPHYEAEFTFARPEKGHSWHSLTWTEYVQRMAEQVKENTPQGEDTAQWNY